MVRTIAGTLVEVGRGWRSPGSMKDVLAARDRNQAGATAPPSGRNHARPADGQPPWESPVYQAVCSPLRNPLDSKEKRTIKVGMTRGAELVGRALARAAGVQGEPLTWEIADGPWFDNQVGTLELDGRRCSFRLESAVGRAEELPRLVHTALRRLA